MGWGKQFIKFKMICRNQTHSVNEAIMIDKLLEEQIATSYHITDYI